MLVIDKQTDKEKEITANVSDNHENEIRLCLDTQAIVTLDATEAMAVVIELQGALAKLGGKSNG